MAECSEPVGNGMITFKCRVPLDASGVHAGPHMAPEIGRTVIEREAWERKQGQAGTTTAVVVEPAPAPAPATPTEAVVVIGESNIETVDLPVAPQQPGTLVALKLGSFDDFEAAARRLMQTQGTLPASLQSWLRGAAAQVALNHLWAKASEAFEAGASSITLTREEVERLVPQSLRGAATKEQPEP